MQQHHENYTYKLNQNKQNYENMKEEEKKEPKWQTESKRWDVMENILQEFHCLGSRPQIPHSGHYLVPRSPSSFFVHRIVLLRFYYPAVLFLM